MSEGQAKFRAFLADLKTNLKASNAGVYVAEKLSALLHNKGIVRVTPKDVRNIDYAVKELQKAHDAIASARAALNYFDDLNMSRLAEAQAATAEYKAVLNDVVGKAYQRRREAAQGGVA